jgi:hypothetical protein
MKKALQTGHGHGVLPAAHRKDHRSGTGVPGEPLGPGIEFSADEAKLMNKKTAQVGPVRDSLPEKTLCHSPRHNELAFTVPMFDEFMKRWMPEPPQ